MSLPFKTNQIKLESKTISEQLRSARQAQNLKLKEVAKYLKIDYKYLKTLETGDLEKLPVGAYGKNFLREYAKFLKLDATKLIKVFKKEIAIVSSKNKDKNYFSKPILKQRIIFSIPKIGKNLAIVSTIAICFFYLGNAVKQIFVSPSLVLESPLENLVTNLSTLNIKGKTEKEVQIIINGEIITSTNGLFDTEINLKKGINIIKVTARKKYGNETIIERQVIVK